jgi:hypothetical protein
MYLSTMHTAKTLLSTANDTVVGGSVSVCMPSLKRTALG